MLWISSGDYVINNRLHIKYHIYNSIMSCSIIKYLFAISIIPQYFVYYSIFIDFSLFRSFDPTTLPRSIQHRNTGITNGLRRNLELLFAN